MILKFHSQIFLKQPLYHTATDYHFSHTAICYQFQSAETGQALKFVNTISTGSLIQNINHGKSQQYFGNHVFYKVVNNKLLICIK